MRNEEKKIKSILIYELGYSEYAAATTAIDLLKLDKNLVGALDKWLQDRSIIDIHVGQFSISQLMENKGFSFPAALIALDWIIKDPETAIKELASNIKR